LLDQLLHQIERLAPTDEQQSVGRNQWRNRHSPLPSPDEFFLDVIDQFGHRLGIHVLQRHDLDRRFALSAGLVKPFDDLRKVRQLLIATSQNHRIELGQHLDLHPLELRQREPIWGLVRRGLDRFLSAACEPHAGLDRRAICACDQAAGEGRYRDLSANIELLNPKRSVFRYLGLVSMGKRKLR
jgi:hypothetical protein